MSKSLISAKVLGGGIAGASGVVGTGYGITRYFKSEETNVPDQSSQTTTETVSEVRDLESPSEVQPVDNVDSSKEASETSEGVPLPSQTTEKQVQDRSADSTRTDGELANTGIEGSGSDGQISGKSQVPEGEHKTESVDTPAISSPEGTLPKESGSVTPELSDNQAGKEQSVSTPGTTGTSVQGDT